MPQDEKDEEKIELTEEQLENIVERKVKQQLNNTKQKQKEKNEEESAEICRRQFLKMLGVGAGSLALSSVAAGTTWAKITPRSQGVSEVKAETATKGVTGGSPFVIEDTANTNNLLSISEGGPVEILNATLNVGNDIQTTGGTTIWDSANSYMPTNQLQNDTITIGNTSISLGNTGTPNIENMNTSGNSGTVPTSQGDGTIQMQSPLLEAGSEPSNPSTGEIWVPDQDYVVEQNSKQLSYTGHSGAPDGVIIGPNNNYAYSYFSDGYATDEVHKWDVSDGSQVWSYTGHNDDVNGLAVDPNNDYLYVATAGEVHQVDISAGTKNWGYSDHSSTVNDVAVSLNGSRIYSVGEGGEQHWIDETGSMQDSRTDFSNPLRGVISEVGNNFSYVYDSKQIIYMTDPDNGVRTEWSLNINDSYVTTEINDFACGPNNNFLYAQTDEALYQIKRMGYVGWVRKFNYLPGSVAAGVKGNFVYHGLSTNEVNKISTSNGGKKISYSTSSTPSAVATGKNGDYFYTANGSDIDKVTTGKVAKKGKVYFWNGSEWVES